MGSSFSVRNDTDVPVIVVLACITPVHWAIIEPGHSWSPRCLEMFYTLSCQFYDSDWMPSIGDIVGRVAGIILCAMIFGWKGFLFALIISGVTSNLAVKRSGVFAQRHKTVVLKAKSGILDKVYGLQIHSAEWVGQNGEITRTHVVQHPLEDVREQIGVWGACLSARFSNKGYSGIPDSKTSGKAAPDAFDERTQLNI